MKLTFFIVISIICCSLQAQITEVNNRYEKGQIENGFKSGIWEYFDFDENIALKIDYDNGTLLYLISDTTDYLVMIDSSWTERKLDRQPRFIGSYHEFYKELAMNLKYPNEARRANIERTVFLTFEVNSNGHVAKINIKNDINDNFYEDILQAFDLIPNLWIPASLNSQNLSAKMVLPIKYRLNRKKNKKKNKNTDIVLASIPQGKLLSEIIVTAIPAK